MHLAFFALFWCPSACSPCAEDQRQSHKPMRVDWRAECQELARGSRATTSPSCWWPADETHSTIKSISYWARVSEWATTAESLFVSGIDQCILSIIWNIILLEAVTVRNLFRTLNLQHKHGWMLEENWQRQQLCAISFVCIINVQH